MTWSMSWDLIDYLASIAANLSCWMSETLWFCSKCELTSRSLGEIACTIFQLLLIIKLINSG